MKYLPPPKGDPEAPLQMQVATLDSDDYDPIAAGVGIELYGTERTAVTLEYMSYSEDAYSGVSIGLKHHFELPSFR